jgi:hypothetical protein
MAKQPEQRPTAKAVLLELLGDSADPNPEASATQLLERSWSPPVTPIPPPAAAGSPPAPPPPIIRPRRRRVRRWLTLLGLVAVAAVLVIRLDLLGRPLTGQPGGARVAATSQPAKAAIPAGPAPLCALLGDLGGGRTLGAPSEDRGFAAAADAAGGWLPEPAALPRALGDHGFQSGCTRTWERPVGPMMAALFQFPSRTDARAMRSQLRAALGRRGVLPVRVPQVTGGELYLLEPGGGRGQLVMFACNERVLQLHVGGSGSTPDPLLVRLAQGSNRRLHERTGCPL